MSLLTIGVNKCIKVLEGQRETEEDIGRQRETERDRERQRDTKRDRKRLNETKYKHRYI